MSDILILSLIIMVIGFISIHYLFKEEENYKERIAILETKIEILEKKNKWD